MSSDVQLSLFLESVDVDDVELWPISVRHAVSTCYLGKLLALLISNGIERGAALKKMFDAKSHEALYALWMEMNK